MAHRIKYPPNYDLNAYTHDNIVVDPIAHELKVTDSNVPYFSISMVLSSNPAWLNENPVWVEYAIPEDKPRDPNTRLHRPLFDTNLKKKPETKNTLETEIMVSEISGASSGTCGASSGTSVGRYKVEGIPERCWCESGIALRMSKTEANPCRRYFRCEVAACKKMVNDNHLFKWVDDALVSDVQKLKSDVESLKEELKDTEKMIEAVYEKMEYGLVEAGKERVKMWKTMSIVLVCSIVLIVGFTKLA